MAQQGSTTGDGGAHTDDAVDDGAPLAVAVDGSPTESTGGAAPVHPAAARTQPVSVEALAPKLRSWEWTKEGGLKGHVYGHDVYSPGKKLGTSRIVEFSPVPTYYTAREDLRHFRVLTAESAATLCEGALVSTRPLSVYRLGAPRSVAGTVARATAQAAQAASAAAPASFSADAPAAVVSEAEGYQLRLLQTHKTGYMHVYARRDGAFEVGLGADSGNALKQRSISNFDTAVAAALWIAKFTAGEDPQTPIGKHLGTGGLHATPPQPQAAAQVAAALLPAPATFSADAASVVSEVDGYKLKLGRSNRTGYKSVYPLQNRSFYVKFVKIQASGGGQKQQFYVYGFATAVAAALWIAYDAGQDPLMRRGEKFRPTGLLALHGPKAAVPAVAAAAPQEGGGTHSSTAAAAPLPVVAWADGVQLYLSENSATGYECVLRGMGGSFVVRSECFPKNKRDASGRPKRQLCATAQEAAVAYARLVAAELPDLQQQPEEDADLDQAMRDAPDEAEVRPVVLAP